MEPKIKNFVRAWLWTGILLITFMVVVGGITRLTGSGLSIVKWKIITGILPPLSEQQWIDAFDEYRESPQFLQINNEFSIQQFKGIFWWEYFHRLAGRIIGLIFIVPFAFFLYTKKLPQWLLRMLYLILLLGAMQGAMGWLMVKSGLNELPYVNHYSLAAHLSLALLLIGFIQWTILKIDHGQALTKNSTPWLAYITFGLLSAQIILGAFVAGLKAGFYYNTFPLMGDTLVPEGMFASFNNGVLIQFIHRWFAFVVFGSVLILWLTNRQSPRVVRAQFDFLLGGIFIQVLLGIFTLLFKVPILLGVLHQLAAVLVFGIMVKALFLLRHKTG